MELQRRLDDLTPLLAAKDAEIERLEMEKTNLISKIRRLSTGTATKQASYNKNQVCLIYILRIGMLMIRMEISATNLWPETMRLKEWKVE